MKQTKKADQHESCQPPKRMNPRRYHIKEGESFMFPVSNIYSLDGRQEDSKFVVEPEVVKIVKDTLPSARVAYFRNFFEEKTGDSEFSIPKVTCSEETIIDFFDEDDPGDVNHLESAWKEEGKICPLEVRKILPEPHFVVHSLTEALKMEAKKYKQVPITPGCYLGPEFARAWGHIVSGYFLLEQALKALIRIRGGKAKKIHQLLPLFQELPVEDQDILREYYYDFRYTFPGLTALPQERIDKNLGKALDNFLDNLDGERGKGSFDWRYYLTEAGTSERGPIRQMPTVNIPMMHEVIYGCVCLFYGMVDEREMYSYRLLQRRRNSFYYYLGILHLNTPQQEREGNRIEILYGPDYKRRHDLLVYYDEANAEPQQFNFKFLSLEELVKDAKYKNLKQIDRREELASLNLKEKNQRIMIGGLENQVGSLEPPPYHILFPSPFGSE